MEARACTGVLEGWLLCTPVRGHRVASHGFVFEASSLVSIFSLVFFYSFKNKSLRVTY